MVRLFKKLKGNPHVPIVAMCVATPLLIFAAVFIAEGGMGKVTHVLAVAGITPGSQTGCVFPCNNTAYQMQQLVPMQANNGAATYTVLPGTTVYWQWIESSYGANNFTTLCSGSWSGSNLMCTVAQGSPNTNFGTCSPQRYGEPYCPAGQTYQECGKNGCVNACYVPLVQDFYPAVGCGNADSINGDTCFGASGNVPPYYSCPGYHGNTFGTTPLTAPSTPGTYTYYLCSNYQLHARSYNSNLTDLPCLGVTLTVAYPPPTCSISPTSQSINQTQSSSWTYSTTNATGITYKVDGGTATTPAGNPYAVAGSGLSVGSHSVIMTVTGSGGSATCGTSGNLTVTAAPAPSCTLTPVVSTNTTGNYSYATFSYTTTNAVSATYKVDGGTAVTPGNNPFNVTGLSAGTHGVIMTVTNSVGATATCGSAGNVTTSALATPAVAITAGGASSVTVPVSGTTTLAWSTSGATPGAAGVTAPSNSATVSSFATITGNSNTSKYFASYLALNGYVYQFGGYDTAWSNTLLRAVAGADLTTAPWTSLGSFSSVSTGVGASINQPVVIGSTAYLFGGYITGVGYTYNICSVPVANIGTVGSWTCSATLPVATNVAQALTQNTFIGDYVYRITGYNSTPGAVSSVARAPKSSPTSWTNFPSVLPVALYGSGQAIIGNYVYLFGGYNGSAPVSTIYRALITSDLTVPASWTAAPGGSIPVAMYIPGVAVDTNYVYLIGGYLTGGTPASAIYRLPLATLAAGNVSAGSWTSAGTLPVAMYPVSPFIVENKLYMGGGYGTVNGYLNKIYSVPFNQGTAYTTPAINPWSTDGGTNYATTWPLTVNSVTYTLNATNAAGSSAATATVNQPDLCTNSPFSGIQNPLPSGVTAVGTTCSCTVGTWNGSACAGTSPPSTLTISTVLPGTATVITRIKKGAQVALDWSVTGLTIGDTDTTCTVSSSPSGAMTPVSWDRAATTWTEGSTPAITITGHTTFTLLCTNSAWIPTTRSGSATVNVIPTFQEF